MRECWQHDPKVHWQWNVTLCWNFSSNCHNNIAYFWCREGPIHPKSWKLCTNKMQVIVHTTPFDDFSFDDLLDVRVCEYCMLTSVTSQLPFSHRLLQYQHSTASIRHALIAQPGHTLFTSPDTALYVLTPRDGFLIILTKRCDCYANTIMLEITHYGTLWCKMCWQSFPQSSS